MYGFRDKYDLVLGVGGTCSSSMVIRAAGMQFASMPMDWAGSNEIRRNIRALVTGYAGFFTPENLVYDSTDSANRHDVYRDQVSGMFFFHDVPHGQRLEDLTAEIAAKYVRRTATVKERLARSKSVLLVYIEIASHTGDTAEADLIAAQREAQENFPGRTIDLVFFHHVAGRAFDAGSVDEVAPHVFKVGLDIAIAGDPENAFANHDVLVPALRKLVPDGALDYRTAAQKRAFARQQREKKYRRMHARGPWEYFVNRLEYGLYKHFYKKLRRAGFTL